MISDNKLIDFDITFQYQKISDKQSDWINLDYSLEEASFLRIRPLKNE